MSLTNRDELQRRIRELEAKTEATLEEKAELKQKRQELRKLEGEGQQASLCSHRDARLEHRFCPSCGESMPALPRTAIEEIVEGVLKRHGVGEEDETTLQSDGQEEESRLRAQYEGYQQEIKKLSWFEQHKAKFRSFEDYRNATASERRSEFQKWGIAEPWRSKSTEQRQVAVRTKR